MNGSAVKLRRTVGALVAAAVLTLLGATIELAQPAAATSTSTAPQQLVHAFPLGPQRLCCTSATTGRAPPRPGPSRASPPAPRPRVSRPTSNSNELLIVVLGAVIAVLLVAGASATYGARRRPATAEVGAEIAARLPAAPMGATGAEIAALERAYRRADAVGDATGAFNLGVLLHERGDLRGAREAYERAERRGDADAAFNQGVLLYEAGDPDGAAAAWRRCVARGHPRAAANLRFLMQRRGVPAAAAEAEGAESADRAYRRADQAGEATGAFNLGVLLHQRGDLRGAREAYERAERRGDRDAAFNLVVLLYGAGDLDGAEAAWRRSGSRGDPRAEENLRFLEQRRAAPTPSRETAGVAGATDSAGGA
jgi:tetratricopeptide (TPR) repeat protein